jgi:magnesium transporter
MASVPLSSPSQAGLLVLPLPLLQPAVGACLRYRLPRLPPGLSSVRKGGLLPLPLLVPPRAVEGNDGRAVTKEEVEEEEEEVEVEVTKEGEEDTQERGGTGATKEEAARGSERFAADYIPLGIREPVYEVSG